MNEEELGDALRAVVRDEPELRFEPDELIATARRRRRRQRSVLAVSASVVALAVGAVAVPTLVTTDQPPSVASGTANTRMPDLSVAPTPADGTRGNDSAGNDSAGPSRIEEGLGTKAKQVRKYLGARVEFAVDDARDTTVRLVSVEAVRTPAGTRRIAVTGWVYFSVGGRKTAISIQTGAGSAAEAAPHSACGAGECEVDRLRSGTVLVWRDSPLSDGESGRKMRTVRVYRPEGFLIKVTAYNYNPVTNGSWFYRPSPLVDDKAIAELALDRKLATLTKR